ncbi:hypothetical protein ACHWQZ_G010474 [Mnemiopsis leidyi]
MEGFYSAETLFQFDDLDFNASNTMDNRKIAAGADTEEGPEKSAVEDLVIKEPDLFTPPTTTIALDNKHSINNNNNNLNNTPNTPSSTPITELGHVIKAKILEQVEFYFSDANVTKDKELAKQIRRNEMGYVSIKWITSFRKIQALTQDWKAVSKVLQESTQLKVSTDKKMVRRKHPIPKKSDQFADKTVMASNLPLSERSVDCVKDYFKGFGRVTLVRFLSPGKPYPDDITSLHLPACRGSPAVDMVAVEFETVEAAELAVLKLSDSNNWRSSSQVQLLRTRQQKHQAAEKMHGPKVRKSSEHCSMAYSLNHSVGVARDNNGYSMAKSLPKQMFGMSLSGTSPTGCSPHNNKRVEKSPHSYSSRSSVPRSGAPGSYGDSYSCSPSANSYLGQRLAHEKSHASGPAVVSMVLTREPRGPDGTRGFGHRNN